MANTTEQQRKIAHEECNLAEKERRRVNGVAPSWLREFAQDADRCAELETIYAQQCRENIALQGENDRLKSQLANCTQCGQLDEMLRQSKDDYELALQENDRIRRLLEAGPSSVAHAGLQEENARLLVGMEKVRMILEGVESFGDGECDAEAVATDLRDVLQTAGLEK